MTSRRAPRTIGQIFAIPAILATVSGAGLVFALIEDGAWDALSWVSLAIPIGLFAICIARGRRGPVHHS